MNIINLPIDNSVKYKLTRVLNLKDYHSNKLFNLDYNDHDLSFININNDNILNIDNIDDNNDINYETKIFNNIYDHEIFNNIYETKIFNNIYETKIFNNIYETIAKYKIKKFKTADNDYDNKSIYTIHSINNQLLTNNTLEDISKILYLGLKKGIILEDDLETLCFGNVFYRKKKHLEQMSNSNSRCLIALDNRLKIINKYLRDKFIIPIYHSKELNIDFKHKNIINQEIHQAKKVVKYSEDNITFNFEMISNIANTCIKNPNDKVQLDISNAFNNVSYSFLKLVLNHYIDQNLFIELLDEKEKALPENEKQKLLAFIKHNFVNIFTFIVSNIKYYDNNIIKYIKISNNIKHINIHDNLLKDYSKLSRNKGLPQGCSFSTDIFIMCMDFIINRIIDNLDTKYNLKYDIDYNMVCYVDDIMLFLKTEKAKTLIHDILDTFEQEFIKFKFKMNKDKTRFSKSCIKYLDKTKYNSNYIIKNTDKFLGIYYENDITKYINIINNELKTKFHQDCNKHSLLNINNFIKKYELLNNYHIINKFLNKCKFRLRLEGKLRYRLSKFIDISSTVHKNIQYTNLLNQNGFDYISKYIFN